jgi:hypothetical protein
MVEPKQTDAGQVKPEAAVKVEISAQSKQNVVAPDEMHRLLQLSEISLWLDGYDDIFSDFDPRHYSERALSDDFLMESKKAAREKTSGTIDLKFLIPSAGRDLKLEEVIRKRLHEHFRKHHHMLEGEAKSIRKKGIVMVAFGFVLMMVSTYLRSLDSAGLFHQFMIVVLEPGGWFITWFGMDELFSTSAQKKPDLEFYSKMSKCEIHFLPY